MSLELLVADLTSAIKEQTALMRALASGKAASAAERSPAKPEAATQPTTTRPTTKRDKLDVNKVRDAYGAYLARATTKADRNQLVESLHPILTHFGVERISLLPPDQLDEAMSYLKVLTAAFEAGGVEGALSAKLPFMSEGEADEAEDEDDGESII